MHARPCRLASSALPLLLASALLVGCLPSSQRELDRSLFPPDSLSRQIAADAPVDTLTFVRRVEAPPEAGLEYPTSFALTDDGIVVAATRRGALVHFDAEGGYARTVEGDFSFPFLAGTRGDTVAVLNRGTHRVDLVVGDRSVQQLEVPEARNGNALLTEGGVFYKTAAEGEAAQLYQFDRGGTERARYGLDGPYWRHLGFLRPWGDSLLVLSGYRPVVDVLTPATLSGATLDTLVLAGFDSPQLERSRLWAEGEVGEPPLLSPAAAALGDRLFVLNARPGWARVDVFRRDPGPGPARLLLERALVQPDPVLDRSFLPVDLAVRRVDGGVEFIVLTTKPRPGLTFLRWTPGEPFASRP
ncbi:MAG: hypothetical protein AAGI91_15950 [Bacteroidota bacterium]